MRGTSLFCIAGIAFGQQALWEKHMQEGDRLVDARCYEEAKAAYQLALRDEERPSDLGIQAARWNSLGLINRYLGNFVEARQ